MIISWCGNDLVTKTRRGRRIGTTDNKMREFASLVAKARELADQVIVVGPGTAEIWHLDPTWDDAARSTISTLAASGVPHFNLEALWSCMDRAVGDTYHAIATKDNAQRFGMHLAACVQLIADAYLLRRAVSQATSDNDGQDIYGNTPPLSWDRLSRALR